VAEAADLGDLLGVCVDTASLFRQCRERHRQLAGWLRAAR